MKRSLLFILGILAVIFAAVYGSVEALQVGVITLATTPMVGTNNQQILKGLKEDMGKAHRAIQKLDELAKTEKRELSTEEEEKRSKLIGDFESAKLKIKTITDNEAREKEMRLIDEQLEEEREKGQSRDEFKEKYNAAFRSYMINGPENMAQEHRDLLKKGLVREDRALTTQTGNSGGYTIPEGFEAKMEVALKFYCDFLEYANVIKTATGNDLPWPTANDTSNTGALLAENTTIGSSTDPTFGVATLKAYKFSSKPILVPSELLVDSGVDIETEISNMLGERLGRIMNTYFTTGTGSSQPQGIVTGATNSSVSAAAAAITFDNLIDLFHTVDKAYRKDAKWMFHDSTLKALRKLKDGNSQYLWQPGLTADAPATILSKQYVINNDMAEIGASAKSVLFGTMSKFKVRLVANTILKRLNERYADLDQVAFIGFRRADSKILDAATHPIKYMAHAAS